MSSVSRVAARGFLGFFARSNTLRKSATPENTAEIA